MPDLLTQDEKARVRRHTGYPEVTAAAGIVFGIPKQSQMAFLLEMAMPLIMSQSVARIRLLLTTLDNLEQQMIEAQAFLVADQLDDLSLAGTKTDLLVTERLENEYIRWAKRLADCFGVPLYPFSERFRKSGQKGMIPVRRG